jgi:glycosyltransferase involved in cell wall biosynthesis
MKKPLVSVIVPVYNVEKYLEECVDSITAQTYENLEIILLPGASTDNSTAICYSLMEKDSRIRIVDQDRNNVGYARNKGIANSNGEYMVFVDSDDTPLPTYVEELLDCCLENDSDITECEYYAGNDDLTQNTIYDVLNLTKGIGHEFYERFGSCSAWKMLIRKSFWTSHDIMFPESERMEDLAVYSLIFSLTDKVSFIYKPLYIYRQNSASLMHSLSAVQSFIGNYFLVADFMIHEFNRLNLYKDHRSTILSQLEHHGEYILQHYPSLTQEERLSYQLQIFNGIKDRFKNSVSVIDIRPLGWGSDSTGILCELLAKRTGLSGRYIQKMTLRGMTAPNIREQFEEMCKEYAPNVIVIDLLEETDSVKNYPGSIEEYILQWNVGVSNLRESIEKICPDADIFVISKYLAKEYEINGQRGSYDNQGDIDILNELLAYMYKQLCMLIPKAVFIPAIPEDCRYSTSDDPKDGHSYDSAYYYEKVMDYLYLQ